MKTEEDLRHLHETFLYPTVRIFSAKAAGSGTLLYSEKDPKEPDDHLTFVLTNHHVVEDLISYKKQWDSLLKREVEKEVLENAKVEHFDYVRMSTVDSSNRHDADIVAYSKEHDLALLKIDSPKPFKYLAKLIPREKIKKLRLFQDVIVSGCSLAHEPFCNFGQLTFLKELIEQKKYLMTNANSVFGNSGGTLYLKDTEEMIGVPSRITGIQLGFGFDVMTWMGFACHPERIYEFLDEQKCEFIYNRKETYYDAMKKREEKEKEALMAMKAELVQCAEAESSTE